MSKIENVYSKKTLMILIFDYHFSGYKQSLMLLILVLRKTFLTQNWKLRRKKKKIKQEEKKTLGCFLPSQRAESVLGRLCSFPGMRRACCEKIT